MVEQLWIILAHMARPGSFPILFGLGGGEHGCPCSQCVNARQEGKSPREGHYCPCEECQKKREKA